MATGGQSVCSGSSTQELGIQKRGAGAHDAQAEGAPADNSPPHSHLPCSVVESSSQGENEDHPGPRGQHRQVTKATAGGAGYFSRKVRGEQPAASLAPAVRTLEKLTTSLITEAGGGKTS